MDTKEKHEITTEAFKKDHIVPLIYSQPSGSNIFSTVNKRANSGTAS